MIADPDSFFVQQVWHQVVCGWFAFRNDDQDATPGEGVDTRAFPAFTSGYDPDASRFPGWRTGSDD